MCEKSQLHENINKNAGVLKVTLVFACRRNTECAHFFRDASHFDCKYDFNACFYINKTKTKRNTVQHKQQKNWFLLSSHLTSPVIAITTPSIIRKRNNIIWK